MGLLNPNTRNSRNKFALSEHLVLTKKGANKKGLLNPNQKKLQ